MTDDGTALEINQDMAFQRREWRIQRIGWWGLSGFVLAAALGLFGHGPLSSAQAGDGRSMRVEYERFIRVGAPSRMTVHAATSGPNPEWQLRLTRQYFDSVRLEQVTPRPAGVDIGEADVVLRFTTQPDARRFTVILDLEALEAGRRQVTLRSGTATAVFTQYAYF